MINEILRIRTDLLLSLDLKDAELLILSLFSNSKSNCSYSFKDVQSLSGLNNQTLSESLSSLVSDKEFLERSRDKTDRRVVRYQLHPIFFERFLRIQRETSLLMIDALKGIVEKNETN